MADSQSTMSVFLLSGYEGTGHAAASTAKLIEFHKILDVSIK